MATRPLPHIAGDYYGSTLCQFDGLPMGNIFAWQDSVIAAPGAADLARAQVIADSMAAQYVTHLFPVLSDHLTGVTSRVYALGTPGAPAVEGTTTATAAVSGSIGPTMTCAFVKNAVFRRGRGSQSNNKIGPLQVEQIDPGGKNLSGTFRTALELAYGNYIDAVKVDFAGAFPGESIGHVQVSKIGTGATYQITSSHVEQALSSQRRRTRRV